MVSRNRRFSHQAALYGEPRKAPSPDLAKTGYFCNKRSFTQSLEGPKGPGPHIWPKSGEGFALGGRRCWLAEIGDFRIKRLFAESLERPRAQIRPELAIFV